MSIELRSGPVGLGFTAVSTALQADPFVLGVSTVQSDGRFTFDATIPQGTIGEHHVVVKGVTVTNEPVSVETPLTITNHWATVDQLALTGSAAIPVALVAIGLVALGAVVLRRTTGTSKR